MSCSLERPPMITATRTRAIGSELTNGDVDRAAGRGVAAAGRVLVLDDVVLVRVATGDVLHVTLKPFAFRSSIATCLSWPTSSGTVAVLGPLETVIVTVEPFAAWVPPSGLWSETMPSGRRVGRRARGRRPAKPAASSVAFASASDIPTTFGTSTCLAPLETSRTISVPSTTSLPAGGSWATTWPAGFCEKTSFFSL